MDPLGYRIVVGRGLVAFFCWVAGHSRERYWLELDRADRWVFFEVKGGSYYT